MYYIGNTIIKEVVVMLDFMPAVVLTSKLCPRGIESTVYAVLAGFQNFGQTVSRNVGAFMIPGPCAFGRLGYCPACAPLCPPGPAPCPSMIKTVSKCLKR